MNITYTMYLNDIPTDKTDATHYAASEHRVQSRHTYVDTDQPPSASWGSLHITASPELARRVELLQQKHAALIV